jgi:transcription elongation factor GreA
MSNKFPITAEGMKQLEEELKKLKYKDRPAVIDDIAEAREHGDLSENAEYHAARERQSFLEGRIVELEDKQARAEVIDTSKLSGKTVRFGATVELMDDDTEEKMTYQIVGEYEADINKGLISIASPIAKALIGKSEGDLAEVNTPKGEKGYEILKVEYRPIELG